MARCAFCENENRRGAEKCEHCGYPQSEGAAIQQSRRGNTFTEVACGGRLVGPADGGKPIGTLREFPSGTTEPYRPVRRAAAATLCILDDGSNDSGERVWIRTERFVIGGPRKDSDSEQPDLTIANDDAISALHTQLTRHWDDGRYRWSLTDLGSKNGTFLGIESSPLKHGDELQIGHRVFRFDATRLRAATESRPDVTQTLRRQAFSPDEIDGPPPELVEVGAQNDEGLQFALSGRELRIGTDPNRCGIVLKDDPTVSAEHARLYVNDRGVWHVADCQSLNGVWLRIKEKELDGNAEFQLGQQRFLLSIPE